MFRPLFLCFKSGPVSHLKSGNSPPKWPLKSIGCPKGLDWLMLSYTHIQLGGGFNPVEKY